jgi:hypothetical protein
MLVRGYLHEGSAYFSIFGVSVQSQHSQWLEFRLRGDVRVYLVGYILCIIDYHICQDIFGRIDIMYCRLAYVSKCALPLKTPAPLYICTSIKQYNHLTFGGTPLSNYNYIKT